MTLSPVYNLTPVPYIPTPPPQSPSGLAGWIILNLRLAATAITHVSLMCPQAAFKPPTTLQDGMVRLSRSPWRPVAGQSADAWVYYDAVAGLWNYYNTAP